MRIIGKKSSIRSFDGTDQFRFAQDLKDFCGESLWPSDRSWDFFCTCFTILKTLCLNEND